MKAAEICEARTRTDGLWRATKDLLLLLRLLSMVSENKRPGLLMFLNVSGIGLRKESDVMWWLNVFENEAK